MPRPALLALVPLLAVLTFAATTTQPAARAASGDQRLILLRDESSASGSFVAAFDRSTGEELWRAGGHGVSEAKVPTAYEARTGRVLWQGRLGRALREGSSVSSTSFGGKIFFTNADGKTFVIASGDRSGVPTSDRLGERVLAALALVEGKWYWRTQALPLTVGGKERG